MKTTSAEAPAATGGPDIAPLVADFYAAAPATVRVGLLQAMLKPVGPLALVTIAAGAFGKLLPPTRWQGAEVTPESAQGIGAEQVLELARYLDQKCPEWLAQLPELVQSRPLWMASVGAALLLALKAWHGRPGGHP
ncbi:MAG TPA: hypothetical protein VIW70_16575 [Rubrivivax sp.]